MRHVFLIPGFFGFANIGRMRYFDHVHRALGRALEQRGQPAQLHDVQTAPTGSLERRAERLGECIAAHAAPGDELHLVGHSTGGLDARLLCSPTGGLAEDPRWAELIAGVKSVTSVATPHLGAPIADFFGTLRGERWLSLLSVSTLHLVRLGTAVTLPTGLILAGASGLGAALGARPELLDQVRQDVLRDFDEARQVELRDFFREVRADRSLLRQLAPEGARRMQPRLVDRPGLRYGSVVLRARPPSRVPSPIRPNGGLYRMLHGISGDWSPPAPPSAGERAARLSRALGTPVAPGDNDAIVPTISQLHGALLYVAGGDHLDVLGWFDGPSLSPPHRDWLRSRSAFTAEAFEACWAAIAAHIAEPN
ncbi:MAG: triacylglycerol lipase [Alphaproteobacteria bacterium]|nr:triacylglycerol lipase [Alphaproteobacteria bacterium]